MLLCDNMIFKSRKEAEEVLSSLTDLIRDYGQATVADFYDLIGSPRTYIDSTYGWTELSIFAVMSNQYGYHLNLSRPIKLEKEGKSMKKHVDIICSTKKGAEEVISAISDLIERYGTVSVADVFNICGKKISLEDNRYGWTSMRGIVIMEQDDFEADTKKYQIVFPKPEDLIPISKFVNSTKEDITDKYDMRNEVLFANLDDLTTVIKQLGDYFNKNDVITVKDLYRIVGSESKIIPEYSYYGWTKFKIKVSLSNGNYRLKLPKIKQILKLNID